MEYMTRCLETIAAYDMNQAEADAYKICCIYHELARRTFPNYRHYPKTNKDPRKTTLFKYCYKLIKDTKGKLKSSEWVFYVKAQMDVMKSLGRDGDIPLIQPACLVGEKAWRRWMLWKKFYNIKLKKFDDAQEAVVQLHSEPSVKAMLLKDKQFLESRIPDLSKDTLSKSMESGHLKLWIATRQLCGYYAILSPVVNEWLKQKNITSYQAFSLDLEYYRPGITPAIEAFFKEHFQYEF